MKLNQGISLGLALLITGAAWAQETTNQAPGAAIATPSTAEKSSEAKPTAKKKTAKRLAAVVQRASANTNLDLHFSPIGNAVVKNENVNVRGKPSFIGEVFTKLKKGETVTLLEEIKLKHPKKDEPTNWFRISLPTNTPVWLHADYIDDANKTVKPPRLNVRSGAGENFSVVARLKKGDAVKQLRKVNDWVEIEAPTNAFGFVAAEFLEKQAIAPSAPPPTELAVVPPTETVDVPAAEEVKPATEAPAEAPAETPAEKTAEPVVATAEPAKEPEVLPKRMVKREGIVKKAWNIQSPTYYQLEGIDDGRIINYLHSPTEQKEDAQTKKMVSVPKFDFEQYRNRRVTVTGEESIDKRWPKWPVLEVETIELQQ